MENHGLGFRVVWSVLVHKSFHKKGARSMPGGYVTAGVVGGTSGLVTGGSDLRNRLCMT